MIIMDIKMREKHYWFLRDDIKNDMAARGYVFYSAIFLPYRDIVTMSFRKMGKNLPLSDKNCHNDIR